MKVMIAVLHLTLRSLNIRLHHGRPQKFF